MASLLDTHALIWWLEATPAFRNDCATVEQCDEAS